MSVRSTVKAIILENGKVLLNRCYDEPKATTTRCLAAGRRNSKRCTTRLCANALRKRATQLNRSGLPR
jgi:hypothetical protein